MERICSKCKIKKPISGFSRRSDVLRRDNWTCQTCGARGCKLEAHHSKAGFTKLLKEYSIKTYEQALKCDELRDLNNGVTLCKPCHDLIRRGNSV
jgi:hypothetical protein